MERSSFDPVKKKEKDLKKRKTKREKDLDKRKTKKVSEKRH